MFTALSEQLNGNFLPLHILDILLITPPAVLTFWLSRRSKEFSGKVSSHSLPSNSSPRRIDDEFELETVLPDDGDDQPGETIASSAKPHWDRR